MKIAVIGVGGVGGYFGAQLARLDDNEVGFIARGKHLEAIKNHGLHITGDSGAYVVQPTVATDNPAEMGAVDVVVVATKAWQVDDAAEAMKPLIADNTVVVPLLNGVEAPAKLATVLGAKHVLGGYCRVLSWIQAPGHVHQSGVEPFVALGEMDKKMSDRVKSLCTLFEAANVSVEASEDIEAAMWRKLTFIAAFSGVGGVTRAPVGVMRQIPQTYALLRAAMQEIVTVAQARDINLTDEAVRIGMRFIDRLPLNATASMQRDIMNGRPSELEAQNGAVVRLGAEVGVETPVHSFLHTALLPAEQKARGLLD